ncbi:MAG: thioredoxin domain-containing protein [Thiohalophilus sp.]
MSLFSRWLGYFGLLFLPAGITADELRNQLADHGSAYLAMHGEDPVHWQQWGADAVALAKEQGKLLYVSSGYFSCHWCHVMQRESYQNDQIATLLNRHFIPVKVDRELNPALDDRLIDFVERTRGYSGWPLNVFITPEGYPLVGMVYQPPEEFQQILERIRDEWQSEPAQLRALARDTTTQLGGQSPITRDVSATELRDKFLKASLGRADELEGGFGSENKFPSVPQLSALLEIYQQDEQPELADFLNITLQSMARQGLYDHLAGGFFRYTVDPGWQVPHFEKMLYDNALLASLYLRAANVLDEPAYRRVALETLAFMRRDFQRDNGGMLSSFSAIDDQGVEGGYYLWRKAELEQLLSETEFDVARRVWGVSGPPELEHGHHLRLASSIETVAEARQQPVEQVEQILARSRAKLWQQRRQRTLPADTKQIAAWNGLALSAFVAGAREDPGLKPAAVALQGFIIDQLWDGTQLKRAHGAQQQLGHVGLEDYAYVAQGLLDYAHYHNDEATLNVASDIIHQAWDDFFTPEGWLLQRKHLIKYGARQPVLADGPMPAPSAVLMQATQTLLEQRSDPVLEKSLQLALGLREATMLESPFWYASHIMLQR